MPLAGDEVRIDLGCGPDPTTGRWRGFFTVWTDAGALRRLGLHPDQPASRVIGPSPPAWWHAAAERGWRRPADQPSTPRPGRRPRTASTEAGQR